MLGKKGFMAIFSRRSLQQMIDSNTQILTKDQVEKHVKALNQANEQPLDFEWGVAILYDLSKLGTLRYEPDLGNRRRLDIIFDSDRLVEVSFAGDIMTVSDRGLHKEIPQDLFYAELIRRLEKSKLPIGCFSYRINGYYDGSYGDRKVRLLLPTNNKLSEFFWKQLQDFLNEVIRFPEVEYIFEEKTEQIDVQIKYIPTQQFF